jgi:hypothetical protein
MLERSGRCSANTFPTFSMACGSWSRWLGGKGCRAIVFKRCRAGAKLASDGGWPGCGPGFRMSLTAGGIGVIGEESTLGDGGAWRN